MKLTTTMNHPYDEPLPPTPHDVRVAAVKAHYAKTEWGKLLIRYGFEPYDTESSARRVAELAATEIAELKTRLGEK